MFSYDFFFEPKNLLPQNRCFEPGVCQISSHLTKCHACRGIQICTWSPLRAAVTMRFAENTQHDTSGVLRVPRKCCWTRPKCCACHETCKISSDDVAKVYCARHAQQLSTRYQTHPCHACQAKRSYVTLETSKNDPSCRIYHRHGHV